MKFPLIILSLLILLDFQSKGDDELSKRLELVRPIAKDGSCGYVALCISEYLERQKVPHSIYMFGIGKYKNIHLMVRVGNSFVDKRGYNSFLALQRLMPCEVITKGELLTLLHDKDIWRNTFDWNDTTEIKKIILQNK